MKTLKLGVLGSGRGSNFVSIQEAILAGTLNATVQVVVSDKPQAPILDHARKFGLPAEALPVGKFKTKLEPEIEEKLVSILKAHDVEWVVLAGYMRVVKAPLLDAFPNRIINIHPSLLPKFKGLEAWKQALEAGESKAGCTVHYVNAGVDEGEIIQQAEVPILPGDTAESLHARIQVAEHQLFPAVLRKLAGQTA